MEFEDLEGFFPFAEMRPSQRQALQKFVDTTNKGRKYTILELPTGIGKSGVAVDLGRWAQGDGAYLLTIQKMLQKQYLDEFSDLVEIKGGSNYRCGNYPVSCDEGAKIAKALGEGPCKCVCPYKEAKEIFLSTPFGLTNFSYFLTVMTYQKGLFPHRKLLIVDEAHNTEAALINHSNIEVTFGRLKELGIDFPKPALGPKELGRAKKWLADTVFPACSVARTGINIALSKARAQVNNEREVMDLLKQEASLDQFERKLEMFAASSSNMWFIGQSEKLEIKPLQGDLFSEELLFSKADHIVFLSATILDPRTFVRNLGIQPKECGYLGLPSEFPKENRRIIFTPAGSMSYKNYDTTLPKLLKKIDRILTKHEGEKGIIHCQSFKTMKHIMDYFRSSPHAWRLLSHDSNSRSKNGAIEAHMTRDEPTVLLSPSMTEGLDLRDDLSRFQIVAKVPYASLADPYVKTRMELDPDWYQLQTALTLVQALGRSVRSSDDHAISYIIDGDFARFMSQAQSILPDWWLDSIEIK